GCEQYPIPVADFKFAIIPPTTQQTIGVKCAEVVLPLDSSMILGHANGEQCLDRKGQSVFIPAYAERYTIECDGRVARAFSA
ncbi:mannose-6-phosphate isomerase, partial [Vibrio cholerae]|nr:mannose-6-phosphate isomerase [Vibrio cholerae]